MGIKNLKKQNKKLNFDLVDVVSQMDPSESGKLMPFLLKMYKKRFLINEKEDVASIKSKEYIEVDGNSQRMEIIIKDIIMSKFGHENLEYLTKFNEHLENKRIENPDITSYNDWDQIRSEVVKADIKILDKELSKQVEVIHQDETWLILKPLSFKASLVYGSNTRWCTSMKNECDYFYRYSKNGILVYTLNKSNGKKYAFYSSPEEFSVWNQVDNRIDSLETNIPFELLLKIKEFSDLEHNVTNFYKFSVEEVQNYENMMNIHKKESFYGEVPLLTEVGRPVLVENGTR
jgi:hypothetical protein